MNTKVLIILGLVAVAAAGSSEESYVYRPPRVASAESVEFVYRAPRVSVESQESVEYVYRAPRASSEESQESYESSEAQYSFNWAVKHDPSRNDFGHQETRDGDNTQGSYYVHLPDGRLQKVKYFVQDDSGYVADVSYEGEAQYPESYESNESRSSESFEAPRYTPPRPKPTYVAPVSRESDESFEVRRYTTPRPRPTYVAPVSRESNESFEAPRYAPPRRVYGVPGSDESFEAPRRVYGVPDSNESIEAPRRTYFAPNSNESK